MKVQRLAVAAAVTLSLLATACGSGASGSVGADADDPEALVVYNAQHESMTSIWAEAFTADTGIKVVLRHGKDFELANQIKQEGERSPAEVFLTENSPAMSLVEQAGLFAPVDPATLAQVPEKYSTSTGAWVGIAVIDTRATSLQPSNTPWQVQHWPTWVPRPGRGAQLFRGRSTSW